MAARTREIITNTKLSGKARLALLWLRATSRNGVSHETNSSISEALGLAEDSVTELAKELADGGFVRREGAGKGSGGGRRRWVLLPNESSLLAQRTAFGTPSGVAVSEIASA
jgi:DNA-binding transcriptional ArsR family regulator